MSGLLLTAVAGCAGSTNGAAAPAAQYLFVQNCAPCHALGGRSSPDPHAPDLAALHLTVDQVTDSVAKGGPGMPRRLVAGTWLNTIAEYVVQHEPS